MPDTNKKITPHENDILTVANIDVDCDVIDTEENYPHKEYFQVRWSGHPHRIPPGQTRKMPRFLAEHYAKHLADHMLMRMEEQTGRKGLVQSSFERPRMLARIILGVDTYFLGETAAEEGAKVAAMVDQLNPGEKELDLGTIPDPMLGALKPEPKKVVIKDEPETPEVPPTSPVSATQVVENTPTTTTPTTEPADVPPTGKPEDTSIFDPSKPKPTRKQLFADCEKLGIEVTGKETVDQLIAKIKAF